MTSFFRKPRNLLIQKLHELRDTLSFSTNASSDTASEGSLRCIELETFSCSFTSTGPRPTTRVHSGLPPAPPRVRPKVPSKLSPSPPTPVAVVKESEPEHVADVWSQATAPKTPEQAPELPQLRLVKEQEDSVEPVAESPKRKQKRSSKGEPVQEYLARLVNLRLCGDETLSECLPLEAKSDDILDVAAQGVLPCKFLNSFIPEAADERALNVPQPGKPLNGSARRENHRLCLNSLKALGRIPKIDPRNLAMGEEADVFKLLWEIVRFGLLQDIDVRRMRELRILQEENEEIFELLQLKSEDLLLRWINFCLEEMNEGDSNLTVQNFEEDLKDCRVYLLLQNYADPDACSPLCEQDAQKRAEHVLANCRQMGIDCAHLPEDLLCGNKYLSQIFVAQLFWHDNCLTVSDAEGVEANVEQYEDRDEGSREERAFRMWMNSLGCDMTCMNLFSEDIRSGWLLLEVLDAIEPGCVNWKLAFKPPFKAIVRRIKSVENCNQVIDISRTVLKASLVGLGGDDIADGKRKPILALVWQLMRIHTLQVLRSAAGGNSTGALSESDVLSWANQIFTLQKSCHSIPSFKHPSLSTGHAVLELLRAIEPSAVQDSYIHPGVTPEQREMNAKYIISIARKLGATIFVVWEDVVEVKPKIMFVLIASLMLLDKHRRRLHRVMTMSHRRTIDVRSAPRQDSFPRDYVPSSPAESIPRSPTEFMRPSPRDYFAQLVP